MTASSPPEVRSDQWRSAADVLRHYAAEFDAKAKEQNDDYCGVSSWEGAMSVWQPVDLCTRCQHSARAHKRPETPFGSIPCGECECPDWRGP